MRSYASDHRTPLAWRHRDLHRHHHYRQHRRRPSPTTTSSGSSSSDEVPMVTRSPRNYGPSPRSDTIRSTRSVPALALATWDGEPCPVHGHGHLFFQHRPHHHGSLFDVRMPLEGPWRMAAPFVMPEPLPIRRPPSRNRNEGSSSVGVAERGICCRGHLVVLWIVLAVVTVGVVLGIVLGVTIA